MDYGGVYSFGYAVPYFDIIMAETFGRVPTQDEKLKITEKSLLLSANKISTREHLTQLGEILSISRLPSVKHFENTTIDVTSPPSAAMRKLVNEARQLGIKVSLLSDMYMFEIERTRAWGRYDGFDYVALSAEARLTKQEPEFFQQTLDHFGVKAQSTFFIDDNLQNIEVAKSVGIVTLLANKGTYRNATELAHAARLQLQYYPH